MSQTDLTDIAVGIEEFAARGCGCPMCVSLASSKADKNSVIDATNFVVEAGGPGRFNGVTNFGTGPYPYTGNPIIDGVLYGSRWSTQEITYSFPTSGRFYIGSEADLNYPRYHEVFSPQQQAATRYAFDLISRYTTLTFREITESDTQTAIIRSSNRGDIGGVGSANARIPNAGLNAGDIWFGRSATNQPYYDVPTIGNWGQATIMHEIGHAMGLKHGQENNAGFNFNFGPILPGGPNVVLPGTGVIPFEFNGQAWSLMTYTLAPGDDRFGGEGFNQPQTYQQAEIGALQYLYGANYNYRATDSVYTFSATTGEMFVNGVGQRELATSNKIFETLWDGGGNDTFDFSNYGANDMRIDLRPGGFLMFSPEQLANPTAGPEGSTFAPGNIALALGTDARGLFENVITGSGNDTIIGNAAANTIRAGAGNDIIDGGAGNDVIDGGAGNDIVILGGSAAINVTLNNGAADIVVTRGSEVDTLRNIEGIEGGSGNDTLIGDNADNTFSGGAGGNDRMVGGAGNDRLVASGFTSVEKADIAKSASIVNNTAATAISLAGAYDTNARAGVDTPANVPHATVVATSAGGGLEHYRIDVVAGATLTLDIDGTSTGYDSWIELVDANGVVIASNDDEAIDPGSTSGGDSRISITFGTGGTFFVRVGQWLPGATQALPLSASQAYTLHVSNTGAVTDVASGTLDASGGEGDDMIVAGVGNDTLDGGAGTDTLSYEQAFSGVTVNMLIGGQPQDTGTAGTDTLTGFENLIGSAFNDTITGTDGNNVIEGGAGNDVMDARGGVDTASYSRATSGVSVNLNAFGNQNTFGAGLDTLVGFENVVGSAFSDSLIGDRAANVLDGGAGDDLLLGSIQGADAGAVDTLNGGAGFDRASFQGFSTDVAATLYNTGTVGSGAAVLGSTGALIANLSGIEGLIGGSGNDLLTGNTGDNTLEGGTGNDTLDGGAGVDTAIFSGGASGGGTTGVTVDLRITTAQNTGRGLDTFRNIENVEGTAFADVINGDNGANRFIDVGGNDTYAGNGGRDTVDYSRRTGFVNVNLTLTTAQNTGDGGVDTLTGIENIIGTAFNDSIQGDALGNLLEGLAGSDLIAGGAEHDELRGGDGDDQLYGDTVNVLTTSDGDDVLDGGRGNDRLVGGQGNDVLRGGSGAQDILIGGMGSGTGFNGTVYGGVDFLDGGEGYYDVGIFVFTGRTGDLVLDARNPDVVSNITEGGVYAGGVVNIERLTFIAGSGNDRITGGINADRLEGADGNDILVGREGNDTFLGGAGNDILDGGFGTDTADYSTATAGVAINLADVGVANVSGGAGTDTLIDIEQLIGSAFSDLMQGDDDWSFMTDTLGGNDRFFGRGGADNINVSRLQTPAALAATVVQIDGGSGDDVLTFNGGTRFIDRALIEGGEGIDTITVSGVDASAINAGGGNDNVSISLLGGFNTVTLGGGVDILTLTGTGVAASTVARRNDVLDFDGSGPGADRLELTTYLNSTATFTGYTANSNPFVSGHMRLIQSGRDMLLQVDRDGAAGTGFGFVTVLTFVAPRTGFTAFSLDGFVSNTLTLTGTAGGDFLVGGSGNDVLLGLGEHDELRGGGGNDELRGGTGDDVLRGDDGDDVLFGEDGRDFLFGGAGRDVLHAGTGSDELYGDADNDVLNASVGNDRLDGGAGTSDTVSYRSSAVAVNVNLLVQGTAQNTGGSGTDTLLNIENVEGGAGNDLLTGDGNANILLGFGSGDSLVGGGGSDYLDGGDGNDTVVGGANFDTLIGGAGNDIFLYQLASDSITRTGVDRIVDFQSGADKLDLRPIATGNDSFAIANQGSDTFVFVDLGRDGVTDTIIRFTGLNAIQASDILLGSGATASSAMVDWTLVDGLEADLPSDFEVTETVAPVAHLDLLTPVANYDLLFSDCRTYGVRESDQMFV